MGVAEIFGIGKNKIIAENAKTQGIITSVKTGWWLTVNRSPIRLTNANSDHPHIVTFRYVVQGTEYTGRSYWKAAQACPAECDRITVYYSRKDPQKYAVDP